MGCSSSSAQVQKEQAKPQPEALLTITEVPSQEKALIQLKLNVDSIDADENGSACKDELSKALDKDAGSNWQGFRGKLTETRGEEVKDRGELVAVKVPAVEKVHQRLKATFDSIDADENGAVSKEELIAKLKGDTDEHGLMKDGSFGQLVGKAGLNPGLRTFEGLDTNEAGRITWDEFEANLRKAIVEGVRITWAQTVKEQGDVMAAEELQETDNGAAPLCGCW